jgi:phospholipid-translocating ATPase
MLDGLYQSVICYFFTDLLFREATFETESGRGVADRSRMGVYAACVSILVINSYILLNTYKWDWIIALVAAISTLAIWFWTGVYSSFTGSFQFYRAGQEVYGALTFWALTLLIWITCLLPRFAIKFFQKNYRPYDVDVIREQVRQGQFDYLDKFEAYVPPKIASTGTSSDQAEDVPVPQESRRLSMTESQRPIYPPSEAPTYQTKPPHSQTGSDGTDRTKPSFDLRMTVPESGPVPTDPPMETPIDRVRNQDAKRPSLERVRSSFERSRHSYEKSRSSFEASRDFTSAALLTRMESSYSHGSPLTPTPTASRRRDDITSDLK